MSGNALNFSGADVNKQPKAVASSFTTIVPLKGGDSPDDVAQPLPASRKHRSLSYQPPSEHRRGSLPHPGL